MRALVWIALALAAGCDDEKAAPEPDLSAPADMSPDAALACDVLAQTCNSGKCTYTHVNPPVLECAAQGTIPHDRQCGTLDGGVEPVDDCVSGLFCTNGGAEARYCRNFCRVNNDCGGGQVCFPVPVFDGKDGLCIPSCQPFGTDTCLDGYVCGDIIEDASGNQDYICRTSGTKAIGTACVPVDDDCVAGSVCAGNPQQCHPICDSTHQCPAGTGSCDVLNGASGGLGFCRLLQP